MDDPPCPPPSRPEIPTAAAAAEEETAGRSNPQLQWRGRRRRRRLRIPHINGEADDGVDRISHLPAEIIHRIVLLLPTKEATRVSALSKTFRSVMGSFPIIDFDFDLFIENSHTPLEHLNETTEKFLNYVDHTIKGRRSRELDYSLQKFKLGTRVSSSFVDGGKDSDLRINRAISFAMERGVIELEIDLAFPSHYIFPKLITSSAKSNLITTLKLRGFKLDLCDLILSYPMIESLSLAHCAFNKDVMILSPNLRAFDLQCCNQGREFYGIHSLQIVAVNLQSFKCRGNFEIIDVGIGGCKNLKDLALSNFGVTGEWLHEQISRLHGLENLVFERCHSLGRVEISHQNLKSLCLLDCYVQDVEVDAPELISFMYKGKVVPFRLLNPLAVDLDATLMFPGRRSWEADSFVRFRNFLSSFDHCKALTLCSSKKRLIFSKSLRDILDSPLCHLKHLKVITPSIPSYTKLVDGLLWLAPHLETLCFSSEETKDQDSNTKFIKFYHGNTQGVGGGGGSTCSCQQHLKCCMCHLKLVEMVDFEGVVDKDHLLKYFQQQHYTVECQWTKKYVD